MYGKSDGTGVTQLSESESYETKRGFGHEEWLDNPEAKLSSLPGYSQAFIQRTKQKHTDTKLYNLALWTRFDGGEEKTSQPSSSLIPPDPLNPQPGSCWLVGFITHLSYVGHNTTCTRQVKIEFPDDVIDRADPTSRFCIFTPNVVYPDGCLKILPRKEWVQAPSSIFHRYNWPYADTEKNAALYDWVQGLFDKLGPRLNTLASSNKRRIQRTAKRPNSGIHEELLDVEPDFVERAAEIKINCGKGPKIRQGLVAMRTHQADFRQALMVLAGGRCMLSGVDCHRLLVASHIKPFSKCKANEAYNPENGLLLARNIDALFDAFLISFDPESGHLLKSKAADDELLAKFGIDPWAMILSQRYLTSGRRKYLKWHNEELVRRFR